MTPTPHDALVRAIFGQPSCAAEELRVVLPPEVAGELRLDPLAPVDGAFIDAALDESNADLLFTVALRCDDGRRAYVLLEHQSTHDERMAWRLLEYQMRIWERHRADHPHDAVVPPILVELLHHGPRPWPAATRFDAVLGLDAPVRSAFGARLLDFEYVLDDLATQDDAALLARDRSAVVKVALLALRNSRSHPRLHELIAAEFPRHRAEPLAPAAEPALQRLARHVLETDEASPVVIRTALAAALRPETRSPAMPTAANVLRAEGRLEARREDLIELLRARFGAVDEATRARIEVADEETLKACMRRVIVAPTLAAVFEA